jgi:hypothetical protein
VQAGNDSSTRRFAGSRANQSDASIDGITLSNQYDGTQISPLVSQIEAFQEVRVDMANNTAEYGGIGQVTEDMAPFDTAEQAASWACVCPGNHESAGKQRDGRTRKGNPWLRSAICEAAWGASRTKKSYFHAQYTRLCARRGPKRALMAVAHSMIVVGFYLIKHDLKFNDLGADFFDRHNREQATRRAVKRLNALGYNVHLEQAASAPA